MAHQYWTLLRSGTRWIVDKSKLFIHRLLLCVFGAFFDVSSMLYGQFQYKHNSRTVYHLCVYDAVIECCLFLGSDILFQDCCCTGCGCYSRGTACCHHHLSCSRYAPLALVCSLFQSVCVQVLGVWLRRTPLFVTSIQ